ncbi:MAG TPA: NAD-dependent epimerase/dehydratase family protein [bacterium]|nr:NAD-dependent epimerase/dehydratase family protein [bacterium]
MRALVTGADGLLGSHLVRRLLAGGMDVRAFVLPGEDAPALAELPLERFPGNLLDAAAVARAVDGCALVFHCAAITDLWADENLVRQVNVAGTRHVLDACLQMNVRRLIFVGSASSFQYGTRERPGDESGAFPREYEGVAYMASKHRAMKLVREYVAERGLDAVIVAPTFMLGAHDFRPSSGELLRQFVRRGMPFVSKGGRNFACADDVAAALVAAAEKGVRGETYIAGGCNLSYREFFTEVAGIVAGTRPPRLALPGPMVVAAGAGGSLLGRLTGRRPALNLTVARLSTIGAYYSSAKAIRELDLPQTPVAAGIEQCVRCLYDFGHLP